MRSMSNFRPTTLRNNAVDRSRTRTGKGIAVTTKVRARIVAAILTAEFPTDKTLATEFNVSPSTVSRLKRTAHSYLQRDVPGKASDHDHMAPKVVEFVHSSLRSHSRLVEHTADEEWLLKQDARGLAFFLGVLADRVIRILGILNTAALAERAKRQLPVPAVTGISGPERPGTMTLT